MTYPVKYFLSDMPNAPRCSGTNGDLVALLDACLINGFNLLSVQSLNALTNVATAQFSSAHGFVAGQIIAIDGATPAGLNGEKKVIAVPTTTTLTFDATGINDGAASGSIGCRIAPVGGWEKVYSGTNKAVYRSTDITSTRLYLRVDDSGAEPKNAEVRGYEAMSDVDTGTGPFPTEAQVSAVNHVWRKSSTADTTARAWGLVGDGRCFYLVVKWYSPWPTVGATYAFGDFVDYSPANAYGCFIHAHTAATPANSAVDAFSAINGTNTGYAARSYTQLEGPAILNRRGIGPQTLMGGPGPAYPSIVDNGLSLHGPIITMEGTTAIRGHLPGVYQPLQYIPLTHGTIVENVDGFPGERCLLLTGGAGTAEGRTAFDITGPWR
jgi:hypothetical protein